MKGKSICFCIRGRNRKSKENNDEEEDSKKLSHAKPSPTPGDDGASGNVHGGNAIAGNDTGVAAAVVTAAHLSVMSVNEGQDGSGHGHGHGHGGESGGPCDG
ncbi:hypothetical protein RIF29_27831 [Crotalaria pallida]|uniref:Uncharacterized protein n=1 Tax=Crotalaria pallida TaxID=3830 RepID=A0AAN9I0T6_CROPI